jgi:hypothetical protein
MVVVAPAVATESEQLVHQAMMTAEPAAMAEMMEHIYLR